MTKCIVSENATEYVPVLIGLAGITISMYNYFIHPEIPQKDRDIQLLASLGTTALANFMATTILKSMRLSTCEVDILLAESLH